MDEGKICACTVCWVRSASPASIGGRGLKLVRGWRLDGGFDASPASIGGRGLKLRRRQGALRACTRIARQKYEITAERERSFDVVRQFYVLVDQHFKEKKQVRDYAEMLFRSPKTLSNLCADYGFPTPLQIIHERVYAEAARLLLYTSRSAKEIGSILGFEDIATFSRFFKKMTGKSIKDFRKEGKQE